MIDNKLTYLVPPDGEGMTVNDLLRSRLRLSRALVVKLKQQHKISVGGAPVYTNYRLHSGELVSVDLQLEEENRLIPSAIPLDIVYEDEQLLAVNKPPGMAVHPANREQSGTLGNAVTYYWRQRGLNLYFRPVNRLDRDTSGLVLVAKSKFAHQRLFQQQLSGEVHRTYSALVCGVIDQETGRIDLPIGRPDTGGRKRAVVSWGQPAATNYRVVRRFAGHTLLSLSLETGRTHQIRVHLSRIGYPVCGDTLYGQASPLIARQALHAGVLDFILPGSERRLALTAPLPADFRSAIELLEVNEG